ncbi:MAG: YhbY family RNA-binding protein [Spirochaetia bacterium]|nr:YhbY family RNA-binding protein [Spirochaetia bacterium]
MLTPKSRSFLSGLAAKAPVLMHLGKGGASEAVTAQLDNLLAHHELVKLKFIDFKGEKKEIAENLASATHAELVRVIGNTAVFFRQNPDPEKRKVIIP